MAMVPYQGGLVREAWDCLDRSSKRNCRVSVALGGQDVNETYMANLVHLYAFAEGSENKLFGNSKEKILNFWFDKVKSANGAGCDVSHESHGNVAGERLDADDSELEGDEEGFDSDYELVFPNLKHFGNVFVGEFERMNPDMFTRHEEENDGEFQLPDEHRRKVSNSSPAGRNKSHSSRDNKCPQRNSSGNYSQSHRQDSVLGGRPQWSGKRKAGDKEKNETLNHKRSSRRILREVKVGDGRCDDLPEGMSRRDGCLANMNLPRRHGGPRIAEKDKERVQGPDQRKIEKEYMAFPRQKKDESFPVYDDEGGNECRYEAECTDVGVLCDMNVQGSAKTPFCNVRTTHEPCNERLKSSNKKVPSDGMNVEASDKLLALSGKKGLELEPSKRLQSSNVERVPSDKRIVVGSAKPFSSSNKVMPEASNKRLKSSMNVEASANPPPLSARKELEPSSKRLKSSDKRVLSNDSNQKNINGLESKFRKNRHDGSLENMNLQRRRGRPRKAEKDKVSAKTPFCNGRIAQEPSNNRFKSSDKKVPSDAMNVEASDIPLPLSGRKGLELEPSNKRLQSSDDERVPSDKRIVVGSARPLSSSGKVMPKTSNKRLKSSMNVQASAKTPPFSARKEQEPSRKRLKSSDKRVLSNQKNIEGSESEFRKKAMKILLKPYEEKEYNDLMKEAKCRRPVMHHIELRGRSVIFPDEIEVDKSYLDRYAELGREIEATQRDAPHKALHLLRGLFFYLQYVCMEDSFLPWKDKSWMEAVRTSTPK